MWYPASMNTRDMEKHYQRYLKYECGLSQQTIDRYLFEMRRFLEFLQQEELTVETAGPRELRMYLTHKAMGKSKSTYANVLCYVRAIFNWLQYEGFLEENPARDLKSPKGAYKNEMPVFLKDDEQKRLRAYLNGLERNFHNDRDTAVMLCVLYTGMRASEICQLTRRNFHRQGKAFQITRKGQKEQILPIADALMEILQFYWYEHMDSIDSDFFFCRTNGKPLTPYIIWQRTSLHIKAAGIDLPRKRGAHLLRHTFATNLVRKGVNLIEIQRLLGHSHVAVTEIYTHTSPEGLRSAVSVLD